MKCDNTKPDSQTDEKSTGEAMELEVENDPDHEQAARPISKWYDHEGCMKHQKLDSSVDRNIVKRSLESAKKFESLNSQIDQLNSVLDVLEKKNDDIQAQLVELLKSSRETRQQMTDEKTRQSAS